MFNISLYIYKYTNTFQICNREKQIYNLDALIISNGWINLKFCDFCTSLTVYFKLKQKSKEICFSTTTTLTTTKKFIFRSASIASNLHKDQSALLMSS